MIVFHPDDARRQMSFWDIIPIPRDIRRTPVDLFVSLPEDAQLIVLECAKQGIRDEIASEIMNLDVNEDYLEAIMKYIDWYLEE